jgi:CRISPR-associated protein Csh1
MLETIKEWGDFYGREIAGEVSSELKNVKHVLTITIKFDGDKVSYKEIDYEEFDPRKSGRYLYARKSSQGVNYTPSALLTEPKKTFMNRILGWYKKYKGKFGNIYKILEENKDLIINDINNLISKYKKEIKKGENILLTMKFLDNGKEKYLEDYNIYREILEKSKRERFGKVSSWGESKDHGKCFICGKEREVFGFTVSNVFPFATIDKPGFAPGLDREAYVKYMPVCEDCGWSLENGKKFFKQYLEFPFKEKTRYWVIPSVLNEEVRIKIFEITKDIKGKEYKDGLIAAEDFTREYVENIKGGFSLSFLFITEQQARWIIESFVEDVFPSWIYEIYIAQKNVKDDDIFSEDIMKSIFYKNFEGTLFSRYAHGKNNWFLEFMGDFCEKEDLINFISSILRKKQINKIHYYFMQKLRDISNKWNDNELKEATLKSFAVLCFLEKLYKVKEPSYEYSEAHMSYDEFEDFFKKYNFNEPWKKAAFAAGVLVRYVLNVQKELRGDTPFTAKLRGLMFDEKRLKKIVRDAENKLLEYDKRRTILEEAVGKYLAEAEGKFNADIDEISYYFTLGLTLGNIFIYKKYLIEKDELEAR